MFFSSNNTQLALVNKKTYTFSGIAVYQPALFKPYLFEINSTFKSTKNNHC